MLETGEMPSHRRKNTLPALVGYAPKFGRGGHCSVPPLKRGRGAGTNAGVAQRGIVAFDLKIEAGLIRAGNGRQIRGDRYGLRGRIERAPADQSAIHARPFELASAAIGVRDFDAIELMLEAAVAAEAIDRTIARGDDRRNERDGERAAAAFVEREIGAGLARRQAHQAEGERGLQTFCSVRAAECGLDQSLGHLKAVDGVLPDFEDDRIARPGGDVSRAACGCNEGRFEPGRRACDGVAGGASRRTSNPSAQMMSGADGKLTAPPDSDAALISKLPGGRGGNAGGFAHHVACGGFVPIIFDQRLGDPVAVEQHLALLRQDAVEVVEGPKRTREKSPFTAPPLK